MKTLWSCLEAIKCGMKLMENKPHNLDHRKGLSITCDLELSGKIFWKILTHGGTY